MCEFQNSLSITQPKSLKKPSSSRQINPKRFKMANQTEDSSRRRVKINSSIPINSRATPASSTTSTQSTTTSNPPLPPSRPTPAVTHQESVYDYNNNVEMEGQPQAARSFGISNERKRSGGEGPATRFIKRFKWTLGLALVLSVLPSLRGEPPGNQIQNWDRPSGMPKIAQLEVMCGAQHMEVHLNFDAPFHGLVASKGMYGQAGCVYVPPRTGRTSFVFNIYYDKCGTKPDNHGKFYENTVVVQYDEELIEAWDEAKRLRCEWFNDYEKTATKTSPMVISDLEIVELNFHGDNVDCWMEIQEGKGPWAPPLNGIVPLGSPLTMVVAVKDPTGEFDMRVKACEASDGQGGHLLPLSDADGCIIRPKLLGKFAKMRIDDGKATVLTYAYINAFKFPDMLNVHLRCTVEICRHGCPNHCSSQYQLPPSGGPKPSPSKPVHNFLEPMAFESQNIPTFGRPNALQEETPNSEPPMKQQLFQHQPPAQSPNQSPEIFLSPPPSQFHQVQDQQKEPSVQMAPPEPLPPHFQRPPPGRIPGGRPLLQRPGPPKHMRQGHAPPGMFGRGAQKFPPRKFPKLPPGPHRQGLPQEDEGDMLKPPGGHISAEGIDPRMPPEDINQTVGVNSGSEAPPTPLEEAKAEELKGGVVEKELPDSLTFPKGPRQLTLRRRRSVATNSDTIGIQGTFRVISQADLDFALNLTSTPTRRNSPILKGRITPGETVYGVCLPRLGFGIVFFGLGLATLVSVLIASFFAYAHYRATVSSKCGSNSVVTVSDSLPPGIPTHPIFPMVILRNFW